MIDQEKFLDKQNKIAVVGVSHNPQKWGWKIYWGLKSAGFEVYAVNPKYSVIGQDACFPSLDALPGKADVVITVIPPAETEKVVRKCKELGIDNVWMQPGSESEEAITFCENNSIRVIYNACFVVDGLQKETNSHIAFFP